MSDPGTRSAAATTAHKPMPGELVHNYGVPSWRWYYLHDKPVRRPLASRCVAVMVIGVIILCGQAKKPLCLGATIRFRGSAYHDAQL